MGVSFVPGPGDGGGFFHGVRGGLCGFCSLRWC